MGDRTVNAMMSLGGKVALVTGVTGHLGGAMATALAEAGASVIVSSRRVEDARAVAERLPGVGDARHGAVAIDHMDEASINDGFDEAVRQGGRVDVLVANAHEPLSSDWRSVTGDEFSRQLRNATGYFLLARRLRDHVVARRGSGSIVLLGSMYGLVGSYPEAYAGVSNASPVAYQVLKGGVVQMARHLGVYWAKDGVRVNCLSPGPFPSAAAPAELVARLEAKCPMGRTGRPEELKAAVVFLAGDGSSFMTGQNLVIDGGWTAW